MQQKILEYKCSDVNKNETWKVVSYKHNMILSYEKWYISST